MRRNHGLARAALAAALLAWALPAYAGWTQLNPATRPSARRSTGMVTEVLADRDRLWIYGGFLGGLSLSNELWYYDTLTANWVRASTSVGRERHMLGFVPRCNMVVIFGGNGSPLIPSNTNDLRTYDTVAGTWLTYTAAGTWPTARSDAAFQYSAERDRIVMFGGMRGNFTNFVNELWELDLGVNCQTPTWIDRSATQTGPPSARAATCNAYLPASQQLFVFGGENSGGKIGGSYLLDVNSHAWIAVAAGSGDPSNRAWMPCTPDSARGVVVLHGGYASAALAGTFLFARPADSWAQFTGVPAQGAISDHAMSYSPHLDGTLQFGGQVSTSSYVDTTWLLQLPVPDGGLPDAHRRDTAQPDAAQPDTAQPDTAQPDTAQPDVAHPDTAQPDSAQPDAAQPDTWQPDAAQPDREQPDSAPHDRSPADAQRLDAMPPDAPSADGGARDGGTSDAAADATICVPTAGDDRVCDGVDSDCDGLFDEDAIASDVCTALISSVCERAACDPVAGRCVISRLSGCCEDDTDCSSPSVCVIGSCDPGAHSCGYRFPENCCAMDTDCDDGNACTADLCDPRSGACGLTAIAHCCNSDADCDDGDGCSLDHCSDRHRCLHQPTACAAGPCAADTSCLYSGLFLSSGSRTPAVVVIADATPLPAWQLAWESEAIGGRLRTIRLGLKGFAGVDPIGPRLRFSLYVDADGDGAIDVDSQPLATSAATALGADQAVIEAIDLALPPAASGTLLIAASLESTPASGCTAAGSSAAPALVSSMLLLLAALRWRCRASDRRRRLARLALIAATAGAVVIAAACLRSGYAELRQGQLELSQSGDFAVDVSANERLWVQSLPLRSGVIQVLR